jgi:D-Tyr-tRNA(Tyr) deacylase
VESTRLSPLPGRTYRQGGGHCSAVRGLFGTDMKVTLTNDGPVTFWLRVEPAGRGAGEIG